MKKILLLAIIGIITAIPTFAYEKHYIKNDKGRTVGYTKTYSNGKTVQYNSKGQIEYTYKKDSKGRITKYSKKGRKLETFK